MKKRLTRTISWLVIVVGLALTAAAVPALAQNAKPDSPKKTSIQIAESRRPSAIIPWLIAVVMVAAAVAVGVKNAKRTSPN